ncbi:MAG TPA: DUF3352 domain-containing protein [Trueperaceae bacterium]|nr:DUF3352 domain-containing protein [Trueperaceae bacterium]
MRRSVGAVLLTLVLSFATSAIAAELPDYLPTETIAAIGVEGLGQHEAKAQPFIDEWNRLNLSELLEAAFADQAEEELPDVAMPDFDFDADLLDFLGREAWVVVSASSFNPLPAVTLLARVTTEGMAAVTGILDSFDSEGEVTTMSEGGIEFNVIIPSGDEAMVPAVAYATFEDVVLVSSNPDVARGVLRRYQGANEPSLATNTGFQATVGAVQPGNSYFYLDLAAGTEVAAPFAAGMDFDALVARVSAAATTAGVYGVVTRIGEDGITSETTRVLGDRSGDPLLYDAMAGGAPVSDGVLSFTPPTALGVTATSTDISGWWDWLGDVVASEPSIGITDLSEMIEMSVGLDPDTTLFAWMGEEFGTITLGYGTASAMPTQLENPLGDSVYLIETTDEAAADAGLTQLFSLLAGFSSSFMDPMGEGAAVTPERRDVSGVSVTDWTLTDGFTLSTAVTGGYALVATTPESMDAVLAARAGGAGLSNALAPLVQRVPQGARSFALSNDQAALAFANESLVDQFGMMSGMMGGDIDFDAVEAATSALGEFLEFATERFGSTVGYTQVNGQVVRGQSFSSVTW